MPFPCTPLTRREEQMYQADLRKRAVQVLEWRAGKMLCILPDQKWPVNTDYCYSPAHPLVWTGAAASDRGAAGGLRATADSLDVPAGLGEEIFVSSYLQLLFDVILEAGLKQGNSESTLIGCTCCSHKQCHAGRIPGTDDGAPLASRSVSLARNQPIVAERRGRSGSPFPLKQQPRVHT